MNGVQNIITEIKVHWALEASDGILRLFELYEDSDYVYLVLEYQAEGSLMEGLV